MSSHCLRVTELTAPSALHIEPRVRLFTAIDECASRIVWLGGPAGSGKTASIAGYLFARGLSSTWCRLSTAGETSRITLDTLLKRAASETIIVLDNCHETASPGLLEVASQVASEDGASVRLILIGRGSAPACLAPLVLNGQIATLPAAELRFSFDEVQHWAARLGVDCSALVSWYEQCEGWALGIARCLETIRRDSEEPVQACERAQQEAFDYLAREVFQRATGTERQVLVSAALPSRPSSRVVDALSDQAGEEILSGMASRESLLTRLPGTPPVYRLMPLFREFLLARVTDTFAPSELQALTSRASVLLEQSPLDDWLGGGDLLEAYRALRQGDRARCHSLLPSAIADAHYLPEAMRFCTIFPQAMAQLCAEALRENTASESARRLIERHRLPAPAGAGQHWPWPFKVHVLGRFRLLKADSPVRFTRRAPRMPLELLQALIAFGATEVPARALIDALWPDSEGDAGYHALESALYRLRQLLGAPDALRMSNSRLSLDRSQFWVDMWEFEEEVRAKRGSDLNHVDAVSRIRQLYQGHFLEHESEKPWALKTRQILRDRFLRYMRDTARTYENRRLWQEAATIYQSGLELDSLSEDLYRGLMVCHRELGDHSEALHAYRRCRELLTKFLGIPPNAKTQAVYFSVRERAAPTSAVSVQ